MKSIVVKGCLIAVFAALLVVNAEAQRTGRKRATNANAPANTQAQQQTNNTTQPSGYNPYGNIPIVVDSSGITDTVVKK